MKKLLSMLLVLAMAVSVLLVLPAMAEGNSIITALGDDPQQMDPTLNSYARSSQVLQNLFKGLYKMDADGSNYIPAMAETVDISEDQLTYTFTLRDGLKWSDGSDLTAYDFEYSWLRVIDPEVLSKAASDLWIVKNGKAFFNGECTADEVGIKAVDEKTFVVTLENVTPWFPMLTSTTSFLPVSKAAVEANENWAWSPETYVCNGPYMLQEYSSLDKIVLAKNPYYYLADDVKLDTIQYSIIQETATELLAYKNNDLNVSINLDQQGLTDYAGSEELRQLPRIGIQYCDFNCELPEFSDNRVRQAFAMAIDRAVLTQAMGVIEKPVYGFVPYAQMSITDPTKSYRDIAGDMFTEDVEAAKALLAEAGYPDGEGFPTITITVQNSTQQSILAQVLGDMWKTNLGINYEIQSFESSVYWDELDEGHFSVDRNGYTCDYADPSANLAIWVTGSNCYENRWDDPVYDELFEKTLSMTDNAEREAALIEAEKYLVDQMPGMPIYSMETQFLAKPEVSGVVANPIGHVNFEYASVEG
ncbi:MAG: peptide ABC transporter substrate-binding protein [Clostridia bacterium]|nr:peptide ABC transporter substrate-binding protein [Clostridia bacterium]